MNTRSTELTLLLLCCTGLSDPARRQQVDQLIQTQPIDWHYLLRLSTVHRVDPLLHGMLSLIRNAPESVVDQLHAAYRHSTIDTLLKQQQYNQISRALSRRCIPHLCFKGIYLAENVYPVPNWRPIGDLDILIEPVSIRLVSAQLNTLQYRLGEKYKPYLRYPDAVMIRDLHEISLFRMHTGDSQFDVDLQWRIDCFSPYFRSFTLTDFSDPRYPVENQVVLLVIHHGVNNCWKRIGYVNDLYFLLQSAPIDWSWLLNRVRQYDLELILVVGLYWCRQLWAMSMPVEVDLLLTTYQGPVVAISQLCEQSWSDDQDTTPADAGLYMMRLLRKSQLGLSKKLRVYRAYICHFLFRPKFIRINQQVVYVSRAVSLISAPWRMARFLYRRLML